MPSSLSYFCKVREASLNVLQLSMLAWLPCEILNGTYILLSFLGIYEKSKEDTSAFCFCLLDFLQLWNEKVSFLLFISNYVYYTLRCFH